MRKLFETDQSQPKFRIAVFQIVTLGLLLIFGIIGITHIWIEQSIKNERELQNTSLIRLVTLSKNIIAPTLQQIKEGKLSKEDGIESIRQQVRQMTFVDDDNENYIFLGKYDGTLLVQPYQPWLENTNQLDAQDQNGVFLGHEIINSAQKFPQGNFVSYIYRVPGSNTPEEKVSFVMGIPELQLYIGAGIYMDTHYRQQTMRIQTVWLLAIAFIIVMVSISLLTLYRLKIHNKLLQEEISKRHAIQQAVEISEKNLKFLFNGSYDAIVIHDRHGNILEVNERTLSVFGIDYEDIKQYDVCNFISTVSETQKNIPDLWEKIISGEEYIYELKAVRPKNGEVFDVEIALRPITWYGEDVIMAAIRDISLRKQTEEALQATEARFQAAVNHMPFDIWVYDMENHQIIFQNQTSIEHWGRINKAIDSGYEDKTEDWGVVLQHIIKGEIYSKETTIVQENKAPRHVFRIIAPIMINNSIKQFMGINIDITDRKLAEEKSLHQLKKLKALRQIDLQIINRTPLQNTLQIVLNEIVTTLDADAISIFLLSDDEKNVLKPVAHYGLKSDVKHCSNIITQQCLPWKVIYEKRAIQATLDGLPDQICHCFSSKGFSAFYGTPLIVDDRVLGMIEVYNRQADKQYSQEWMDYLEALAGQVAIAIDSINLIGNLQKSNLELNEAYEATIKGWSKALELRDEETQGHSERVMYLACELANEIGIPEEDKTHFRRGVLLHDIGKMGIPDNILLKPGPLTTEEWEIMRQHPEMAYRLLEKIPYLRPALDIPYSHHERWNGSGYPRGLAGEAIPLTARIFAVVDVWDALISDRPYRNGWRVEDVKKYLRENAGILFDPLVVGHFLNLPAIRDQSDSTGEDKQG